MKYVFKFLVAVVVPVTGFSALFSGCASTPACNNDACYDRKISSVDPYKKGDIAAWGTEKKMAEQEDERDYVEHKIKKAGE